MARTPVTLFRADGLTEEFSTLKKLESSMFKGKGRFSQTFRVGRFAFYMMNDGVAAIVESFEGAVSDDAWTKTEKAASYRAMRLAMLRKAEDAAYCVAFPAFDELRADIAVERAAYAS